MLSNGTSLLLSNFPARTFGRREQSGELCGVNPDFSVVRCWSHLLIFDRLCGTMELTTVLPEPVQPRLALQAFAVPWVLEEGFH